MADRIHGKKVSIDVAHVAGFFSDRANRYEELNPVVSMLYQDSNPELALKRDAFEGDRIEPLLAITPQTRFLDVGCGLGRWATKLRGKIGEYHGIDPIGPLVDIAETVHADTLGFTFQKIAAEEARASTLSVSGKFDVVMIAGVLQYLNDDACVAALQNAAVHAKDTARILIRVPVGVEERLTLKDVWSEELKHEYSAIYRTVEEYHAYFSEALFPAGFQILHDASLYPPELNNRAETRQHVFMLARHREEV